MHEQTAQASLTLYSQAAALKLLPHTSWLQRGVAHEESVAEHTFGVAVLALLIGDSVTGLDRGRKLALDLLPFYALRNRIVTSNLLESDVALAKDAIGTVRS